MLKRQPPPSAVTLFPEGILTRTGLRRFVVVPSPSSASPLLPQARTRPAAVSAMLCQQPPARLRTLVPLGSRTPTGLVLLIMVPSPTWPYLLSPQASAFPAAVRTRPV